MKKRNLAILLIIPFLVSLFGIVTINAAFNLVDNDVIRIEWDYRQNELFDLDGGRQLLTARGILAKQSDLGSAGSKLVWSVENADGATEPHAAIESTDNINSYLVPKSVGQVVVTCTTEKGNIAPMRMNAYIYRGNAFVVNTKTDTSAQNVDETLYYGRYDRDASGNKVNASIPFDLTVSDDELLRSIVWDSAASTSNVEVEIEGGEGVIRVLGMLSEGESTVVAFRSTIDTDITAKFPFMVVDGINVYTYEDLLSCTNLSERGETVVLRKHFESYANCTETPASNVTEFGTHTANGFNFANEVYRFPTTYNHEYIDQWNEWVQTPDGSNFSPVGLDVIAGLRVQKDFYGNGYRLNLHDLCYPSMRRETTDGKGTYEFAVLGQNDLFRGPKPFYLLGDPNGTAPLVTAYGQDNVGIYLDGDNITFNDVKVSNADFGLIVSNLNYTGTVLEVKGNGTTVKNCVLQNGKNILRSFSSKELTIDNCILSTSRNFLLEVGSNNYLKNLPDATARYDFTLLDGTVYSATTAEFLAPSTPEGALLGDKTLSLFVAGFADPNDILEPPEVPRYDPKTQKSQMKAALHSLQQGLDQAEAVGNTFDGTTTVSDTVFYRSGIASIGVNNMFNGPFLYNNSPSLISAILGMLGGLLDAAIPMFPNNVSGASLPVSVELTGDTKFYDYKPLSDWDISGLIDQHIGDLVAGMDLGTFDITIDDIFPLKSILTQVARGARLTHTENTLGENGEASTVEYISIPVAYYGGGRNASLVTSDSIEDKVLSSTFDVDLLDNYLDLTTSLDLSGLVSGGLNGVLSNPNFIRYMKEVLTKTVTAVTGFEPFRFQFETSAEGLFDKDGRLIAPNYRDLIRN